ncbi:MAG: DUF5320 domain-containing protein [Deltaproteobacteria bacterium]|nr:DUF5320 domain-containing protein [Deltaproteobacteria bacterium]MBW1922523.1 DUF5320 domain-containing protein [Deltaproteobacteria bacterium]MBW1948380.1 DUF5320 domain-containing protein [Deltaproteobacteria bacterium]MBW2007115.1 DUF5320 domain-containing protein [Deltaproteobacteria bacterium]MBW2103266.1 DUF5320 domain-containing protein [Deltaproteobacteria bacterium]
MPGFDGTGPWGEGPMTGGARGLCNPAWAGYGRRWPVGRGRGYGRGFGRGMGWRRAAPLWGPWPGPASIPGRPYAMSEEDEMNMLKDQAEMLRRELDAIQKRVDELETKTSD